MTSAIVVGSIYLASLSARSSNAVACMRTGLGMSSATRTGVVPGQDRVASGALAVAARRVGSRRRPGRREHLDEEPSNDSHYGEDPLEGSQLRAVNCLNRPPRGSRPPTVRQALPARRRFVRRQVLGRGRQFNIATAPADLHMLDSTPRPIPSQELGDTLWSSVSRSPRRPTSAGGRYSWFRLGTHQWTCAPDRELSSLAESR